MPDTQVIRIERLAHGGDAVGRLADGRVAFVRYAAPGDLASVEVTEDHGRFVRAALVELEEPSALRVEAPCPYFGACGGCQWQHVAYSAQLEAKRAEVVDSLQRIAHLENAEELVSETLASPKEYGYRNKVELCTPAEGSRGLSLGFSRMASAEIIEIDRCLLLPDRVSRLPKAVRGALRYVQGASDLGIRRVGIRSAVNTRDIEIAIWTAPGSFPRKMAAETLTTATKASSIVRVITGESRGRSTVSTEVLAGKGVWRERMLGRTFGISAPTFFQVNTVVAEQLVRETLGALEVSESDRVVDLFAGAGTFTLPLAEETDVSAVEAEGSAVRDLRRNLEGAGLYAEVIGGDAARELPDLGGFDIALVDPPRAGLAAEVVSALAEASPRAIAYVSCDPATLARDAARLGDAGYALRRATPIDLFPQTWHVETLALFEPAH